jgi:hypothetical protein
MKRISVYRKLVVLAGCVSFVCAANVGVSFAANVATSAGGQVVTPIAISKTQDLQFGKFIAGTGGSLTIAPGDALGKVPAVTGTVVTNATFAAAASPASFTVTGESGAAYSITLPSSATLTHGADSMTVDSFLSDAGGSPVITGGSVVVNVGAKVTVASGQNPGVYAGSFNVSVDYP